MTYLEHVLRQPDGHLRVLDCCVHSLDRSVRSRVVLH
jgi:hypothetical protein